MAAKKQPVEKVPEQKFVLRLPESLHHALRHVSIDRKTSLNALIVDVLEGWWAKQPEVGKYPSGLDKRPSRKK